MTTPSTTWLTRVAAAGFGVAVLTSGPAATAQSTIGDQASASHGKVVYPTREAWRGSHQAGGASGFGSLSYGGGVDSIGVTTGAPRVYLVFWGTQWGTSGTDSGGNTTLSGDPQGVAVRLQQLLKGLGTNSETWSGVMTQYCEGVSTGATSCPSSAAHVGYPSGGALAGMWVDQRAAAPSAATEHQLAVEAVDAAGQFGNTTSTSNRDAQYVVVSPTGTSPDNYLANGFCAWHDWNGDTSLTGGAASSPYGDIAFTNLPYIPDAGASCGANYVNTGTSGALDGVTIVEGHEYAETITDQNPAGGWTDLLGYENADKCAWNGVGGTGGAQNVTFATGSFAMQATYSNDSSSCRISHAIVGSTTNTVTVTNPGNQTSTAGSAVSLQIQASDSASGQTLTYSAAGLPTGLSINASTGLISGTASSAGSYSSTVTATDTTGAHGSATFGWTVNSSAGCSPTQVVGNSGFESGTTPWAVSTSRIINNSSVSGREPPFSGSWDAWLDGYGKQHTDTLSQSLQVPAGCSSYTLSFQLHIDTAEATTTKSNDRLTVSVGGTTLATFSNLNHVTGYALHSYDVSSFAGQTVTLTFTGRENKSQQTSFVLDDVTLDVS